MATRWLNDEMWGCDAHVPMAKMPMGVDKCWYCPQSWKGHRPDGDPPAPEPPPEPEPERNAWGDVVIEMEGEAAARFTELVEDPPPPTPALRELLKPPPEHHRDGLTADVEQAIDEKLFVEVPRDQLKPHVISTVKVNKDPKKALEEYVWGRCSWKDCEEPARRTSIYCSRSCSNKNARWRHRQRQEETDGAHEKG